MSVGDVTRYLVGKVSVVGSGLDPATTSPDWTYRPHPATVPDLPGQPAGGDPPWRLPAAVPVPAPALAPPAAVAACDCGRKLDALLKVLSLPGGLRGLVLALAAAPDADALDVLADYLEERMDPRTDRFRGLAGRARKGAKG
jgi:hypothetical protein